MDIVGVVSSLDTYWTVFEAELSEIDKDINHCYTFQKRYGGQYWTKALSRLQTLRSMKESNYSLCDNDTKLRDIRLQMELFHLHIESGRQLCVRLAKDQPMQKAEIEEGDDTYAVYSSILAHANTITDQEFIDSLRKAEEDEVLESDEVFLHRIPTVRVSTDKQMIA